MKTDDCHFIFCFLVALYFCCFFSLVFLFPTLSKFLYAIGVAETTECSLCFGFLSFSILEGFALYRTTEMKDSRAQPFFFSVHIFIIFLIISFFLKQKIHRSTKIDTLDVIFLIT